MSMLSLLSVLFVLFISVASTASANDAIFTPIERDGWKESSWFGWYQDTPPYLWHLEHGYIWVTGETENFYFYNVSNQTWLWSSVSAYPLVYAFGERNGWYYYYKGGAAGERWFYSYLAEYAIGEMQMGPPMGYGDFVSVPAGSFMMGDALGDSGGAFEHPYHEVFIPEYKIKRTVVTKKEWDEVSAWAADNGYDIRPDDASGVGEFYPAYNITWVNAAKYANAMSERSGRQPVYTHGGDVLRRGSASIEPDINYEANGYRLPTEAEWEKAARGGQQGLRFPWGDSIGHQHACYRADPEDYTYDISNTEGRHPEWDERSSPPVAPVMSFVPNGYGLYDFIGSFWEWTNDWFTYYGEERDWTGTFRDDPKGPVDFILTERVARGGNLNSKAPSLRVSARGSLEPEDTNSYTSFRLVYRD